MPVRRQIPITPGETAIAASPSPTPPRRLRRLAPALAGLALLAALVLFALVWRPPIAPIEPPAPASFDRALVQRGAALAAVGNCAGCHTAADGAPLAGGVAMATPFGTVYGTNITPEPRHGIGRWSQAAFDRAMRAGIARNGRHLYPAFPYDHFTRVSDEDLQALYAWLMTRDPVEQADRANAMRFPFQFRPLVAGWNILFLRHEPIVADPRRGAAWNRGAYLVNGLGHCAACHSPRNALGAVDRARPFAGGEAEGWYVPALDRSSPSPQPWTIDELATYLRTGIAERHAAAGGPMQSVVHTLARADESDLRAIATYISTRLGEGDSDRQARAAASLRRASQPLAARPAPPGDPQLQLGARVYADACARCHDAGRRASSGGALQMPLAVAIYDPDPRSLLRIVREGIAPPEGERGRWMPAFEGVLTDTQIAALAAWLRREAANQPAWPQLAQAVQETRR